jgi:hypothetical protein
LLSGQCAAQRSPLPKKACLRKEWLLRFDGVFIGAVLLLASDAVAFAQQLQHRAFFGKTVSYTSRWCERDDEGCKRGSLAKQTFRFATDGTLIEAFMCGDPIERKHKFGSAYNFRKVDRDGMKSSTTVILGGSESNIDIQTDLLLQFKGGGSSTKSERFKLTWLSETKCSISGTREIRDLPDNDRRLLLLVSNECQIH